MNEITVHGNVTATPVLRRGQTGNVFLTFSVAVNRSYYARERGTRVEQPPVYHDVIAFNVLAENAAASLRKGTTVTVTGYLADNSFTPEGSDQRIRRTRLEAGDIAVSLRFATAEVTKRTSEPSDQAADSPAEPAA
jgi:single-strand DNA-binding protein